MYPHPAQKQQRKKERKKQPQPISNNRIRYEEVNTVWNTFKTLMRAVLKYLLMVSGFLVLQVLTH
jgi:hypothetical protein